mmetsp:Transcript_19431/g.43118  ORF Transcript_19431/g.43118 Transcript_19431/m.43118 type:complete len:324 (+) Transcript_19431:224-1195(+)
MISNGLQPFYAELDKRSLKHNRQMQRQCVRKKHFKINHHHHTQTWALQGWPAPYFQTGATPSAACSASGRGGLGPPLVHQVDVPEKGLEGVPEGGLAVEGHAVLLAYGLKLGVKVCVVAAGHAWQAVVQRLRVQAPAQHPPQVAAGAVVHRGGGLALEPVLLAHGLLGLRLRVDVRHLAEEHEQRAGHKGGEGGEGRGLGAAHAQEGDYIDGGRRGHNGKVGNPVALLGVEEGRPSHANLVHLGKPPAQPKLEGVKHRELEAGQHPVTEEQGIVVQLLVGLHGGVVGDGRHMVKVHVQVRLVCAGVMGHDVLGIPSMHAVNEW